MLGGDDESESAVAPMQLATNAINLRRRTQNVFHSERPLLQCITLNFDDIQNVFRRFGRLQ